MKGMIDAMEKSDTVYTIITNSSLNGDWSDANDDRNVIHWNPNLGLQCGLSKDGYEVGAILSPALSLGHELAHTQFRDFWLKIEAPPYDNMQDKFVITEYENVAAQTLGEGIRHDHGGTPVRVPTPLSKPKCNCINGMSPQPLHDVVSGI